MLSNVRLSRPLKNLECRPKVLIFGAYVNNGSRNGCHYTYPAIARDMMKCFCQHAHFMCRQNWNLPSTIWNMNIQSYAMNFS